MAYVSGSCFGAVEPSAVKKLQEEMIRRGFLFGSAGKADGVPGPATFAAAVKWARAILGMNKSFLPAVERSGIKRVAEILGARIKELEPKLNAAEAAKDPQALASVVKQLAAMFRTAANDVQAKPLSADSNALLDVDLSVLGTKPSVKTSAPPKETVSTVPVVVSAESSGGPSMGLILGGVAAAGVLAAVVFGKKKKAG